MLGPGITNAMLAIGIAFIPSFMRLTRGNVLAIREQGYVEAARAIGVHGSRIVVESDTPSQNSPG